MEVNWPGGKSSERWVACVKDHRSEPLPLELAKRAAVELLALKSRGEPRPLIAELNDYHAEAVKDAEPLFNISDEPRRPKMTGGTSCKQSASPAPSKATIIRSPMTGMGIPNYQPA